MIKQVVKCRLICAIFIYQICFLLGSDSSLQKRKMWLHQLIIYDILYYLI